MLPGVTPAAPDDDGAADPALAEALARADDGPDALARARTLLLRARLLVPVVAVALEVDDATGADKQTEMAVPDLVGADGRRALPAFTSYDALRAWRADARPVPMTATRVIAGAAAQGYAAVVVDVAGPVMHVLEGEDLRAMASAAEQLARGHAADIVIVP